MTTFSMCAVGEAPSRESGATDAAAGALGYAANAFSGGDDACGANGPASPGQRPFDSSAASAQPVWQAHPPRGTLPEGYLALREVKDLGLLGRWTPLEDKMSPCMPKKVLAAMQRRHDLGDADADAWLNLHSRAYGGDPDAQRLFGRVCESGLYRSNADLQRAFFWYYRAALQGDAQARNGAERLMRTVRISSAAMAEPVLVYPGQWLITAHLTDNPWSVTLFELAEDGNATGRLAGDRRPPAGAPSRAWPATARACTPETAAPPDEPARFHGGWAYDAIGNVLTIVFDTSNAESRRWRSDYWQIEILGCRSDSLLGRDRRSVCYTMECVVPADDSHASKHAGTGQQ